MQIDKALILRLEKLARLQLSESEQEKFAADLSNILQMVDKLHEVDTEGVEPLIYVSNTANVFRDDIVQHQLTREQALQNAPKHDGTYFRTPKVID
jgi:aspartyl-tRNA(Asn)/glutamyl-tRNA(Gln) amidotransferase subunit C